MKLSLSQEHFIEYKLIELYENYVLREKNSLLDHLRSKLNALYSSLDAAKREDKRNRSPIILEEPRDDDEEGDEELSRYKVGKFVVLDSL